MNRNPSDLPRSLDDALRIVAAALATHLAGSLRVQLARALPEGGSPVLPPGATATPLLAYTVEEAAQATRIGINQIRADITAGRLKARLIGRTKRIVTAEDLRAYLDALPAVRPS